MSLAREPARPHDPGYPTFSEFDPRRRAALRAIALAGLSAAGLQLVGCPGGGGGAPPTGTGTGPATDTGPAPATEASPPTDTDWVPWREPETETGPVEPMRPGGAVAPRPFDVPLAIVVGGGPIDVVFSDGRKAKLAVALVVQPGTTPGAVKAGAPEHVEAVKAAARSLPGSVCDSAQGHETLSTRIQEEVLKATPGLVIEGVQAAPVHEPAPPPEQSRASAPAPAPAAAAAAPSAAPAPASTKPARAPLSGKQVWIPCGKPGCTSCGK